MEDQPKDETENTMTANKVDNGNQPQGLGEGMQTDSTETQTTEKPQTQEPENFSSLNPITQGSDSLQPEALIRIYEAIQLLQTSFDSKLRYDGSKERVIDTLHKELQTYRDGLYFQILRPMVFALIEMHDDLTTLLAYSRDGEDIVQEAARLRENLASFKDSIESTLEHHGISVFCEPGSQYIAQRQRIARTETTTDPELDKQVSRHIRKGFEFEGRVIRPEVVNTFKYVPETTKSDQ